MNSVSSVTWCQTNDGIVPAGEANTSDMPVDTKVRCNYGELNIVTSPYDIVAKLERWMEGSVQN